MHIQSILATTPLKSIACGLIGIVIMIACGLICCCRLRVSSCTASNQVGEGLLFKGSTHKVDRADLADLIVAAVQDEAKYKGKTLYIST
jgi:hypothetical protein